MHLCSPITWFIYVADVLGKPRGQTSNASWTYYDKLQKQRCVSYFFNTAKSSIWDCDEKTKWKNINRVACIKMVPFLISKEDKNREIKMWCRLRQPWRLLPSWYSWKRLWWSVTFPVGADVTESSRLEKTPEITKSNQQPTSVNTTEHDATRREVMVQSQVQLEL